MGDREVYGRLLAVGYERSFAIDGLIYAPTIADDATIGRVGGGAVEQYGGANRHETVRAGLDDAHGTTVRGGITMEWDDDDGRVAVGLNDEKRAVRNRDSDGIQGRRRLGRFVLELKAYIRIGGDDHRGTGGGEGLGIQTELGAPCLHSQARILGIR